LITRKLFLTIVIDSCYRQIRWERSPHDER